MMLTVLPWLGARDGASIQEICDRFGTDPETLKADLSSVFLNVEPEVGPDHMIDVVIDGDWVSVKLANYFRQPPRLDHNEALVLLAAGNALRNDERLGDTLPGALDKLAGSLGPRAADAVEVDLGPANPDILAAMERAISLLNRIDISYFSWGRHELATRTVDPWGMRSVGGHWYLTGWCHMRQSQRHFRVDRIQSLRLVGDPGAFEAHETLDDPARPKSQGARVELRVPAENAWVLPSDSVDSYSEDGDDVIVTLHVDADAFLDRLLLRLGDRGEATDTETGESLASHRRDVATTMLRRYEAGREAAG
jgi:proteasome accessory factor C